MNIEFEESLNNCINLSNNLFSNGFSIVDNILSLNSLNKLYSEIELLYNSNWMEPSGNILQYFEGEIVKIKPNVYERSLVMKNEIIAGLSTMNLIPTLYEFWNQRQLLTEILTRKTGIVITSLDQIKVAAIEEGGSFMIHTDKMPNTTRILTMTLYLNNTKEEYNQEEGGHLRVYPLINHAYPHIVDICPIFGRAVLFSSTNLPHRVLPSKSSIRYCISFFFYGETYFPLLSIPSNNLITNLSSISLLSPSSSSSSSFEQLLLTNQSTESLLLGHYITDSQLHLILEKFRREYSDLCPLIYQNEYCRSIYESFSDNENDEIVHSAVQFFNQKCFNYYNSLDNDIKILLDLIMLVNEQNKSYFLI